MSFSSQLAGLKERITQFEKRIKALKNEAAEQNQFTLKLDLKVSDIEKEISRLQKRIDECAEETKAADEAFQKLENDKKTAEKNLGEVSAKQEETIRELLVSLKNEKNRWEKTAKNRDEALQTIEACCEALAADPGAKSNITKIREKARVLAEMSRGLYEILFEKGGVHSRKEELDEEIAKLEKTLAEAGKGDGDHSTPHRELDRVVQQVPEHLAQARRIAESFTAELPDPLGRFGAAGRRAGEN